MSLRRIMTFCLLPLPFAGLLLATPQSRTMAASVGGEVIGECRGGSTASTVGLDECLRAKLTGAEDAMAAVLESVAAEAARIDAAAGENEAAPAVRAAQTAWVAYRDAHCALAEALAPQDAGVSGNAVHDACVVEMVRERTAELRALTR